MRTGLSALAGYDDEIDNREQAVNKKRAYQLLGQLPTVTVNAYRIIKGEDPVNPDPTLSYSPYSSASL